MILDSLLILSKENLAEDDLRKLNHSFFKKHNVLPVDDNYLLRGSQLNSFFQHSGIQIRFWALIF